VRSAPPDATGLPHHSFGPFPADRPRAPATIDCGSTVAAPHPASINGDRREERTPHE